jgi:hypothetical protein
MLKTIKIIACFILMAAINFSLNAQSFKKGSLVLTLSEGGTSANYVTHSSGDAEHPGFENRGHLCGERDPIFLEYGLSSKWGIGIYSGNDIFRLNPEKFYGFKPETGEAAAKNEIDVISEDVNLEGVYHFFVNEKFDVSAFSSAGLFSVSFKNKDNE